MEPYITVNAGFGEARSAAKPGARGYVPVEESMLDRAQRGANRVRGKAEAWEEYVKRFPAIVSATESAQGLGLNFKGVSLSGKGRMWRMSGQDLNAVDAVGKKPAARKKPGAALPFKVKKLPLPPPKEFHDGLTTGERLLRHAGTITDEVAEVLMEAIRLSRQVDDSE